MRKTNKSVKSVKVSAPVVAAPATPSLTIKVRTTGPRGGAKIVTLTTECIQKFKNGNRRAVVALGKRGGKVTVYAAKGEKSFASRTPATV